jgi:hypothetical protein
MYTKVPAPPSLDDKPCENAADRAPWYRQCHVHPQPPTAFVNEKEISTDSSTKSLSRSSGKPSNYPGSHHTVPVGWGNDCLPNGRAEKQAARDKETWASAKVDGQWDPNKVLYISTESVGITARPIVRTIQLTNPLTASVKSTWKSSMMRTRAAPIPARIHIERNVNTWMIIKAAAFFYWGQLRGSLGSSEGCGTSWISVPALFFCWWDAII